jgi:hypothetical protein
LLPFEILVNREEMFNFTENVRMDVRVILQFDIPRIPRRVSDDLLITDAVVQHFEKSNWANVAEASREAGHITKHEDVEWVAVLGNRLGDETVVARIVDWGMQVAVQDEDLQIEIILILVDAVLRDLDDRGDDFRGLLAYGKFQIIIHFAPSAVWPQEQKKDPCAVAGVISRSISGGA